MTTTKETETEQGEQQQQRAKRPGTGKGRGFASLSPAKKREVASKGGYAAQASGKAHHWTREEAQEAGRKGGSISRRKGILNGKSKGKSAGGSIRIEGGGGEKPEQG